MPQEKNVTVVNKPKTEAMRLDFQLKPKVATAMVRSHQHKMVTAGRLIFRVPSLQHTLVLRKTLAACACSSIARRRSIIDMFLSLLMTIINEQLKKLHNLRQHCGELWGQDGTVQCAYPDMRIGQEQVTKDRKPAQESGQLRHLAAILTLKATTVVVAQLATSFFLETMLNCTVCPNQFVC